MGTIQCESLASLLARVKECLSKNIQPHTWIRAEISEMSVNYGGHCFMELIDKNEGKDVIVAKARATIWANVYRMVGAYFESVTGQHLEKGMKVMLRASVEFHEVYGLSLNIVDIDPTFTVGEQELQRRKIINQLAQEGVIDMNRSCELPLVVQSIAVISSESAAGYEDFRHQLFTNTKGYHFKITLFPCVMQGPKTSESIIQALDTIYQSDTSFDAVVIIRGGGSKSDLAWFDSYEVAVNIAQFPLPVISGIGHERDYSIVDMVSHTSLKTPTAVAEFLVEKASSFENNLDTLVSRSHGIISTVIQEQAYFLHEIKGLLSRVIQQAMVTTERKLQKDTSRVSEYTRVSLVSQRQVIEKRVKRLEYVVSSSTTRHMNTLQKHLGSIRVWGNNSIRESLHSIRVHEEKARIMDPATILSLGYSITLDGNGVLIRHSGSVKQGDVVTTRVSNGTFESKVL